MSSPINVSPSLLGCLVTVFCSFLFIWFIILSTCIVVLLPRVPLFHFMSFFSHSCSHATHQPPPFYSFSSPSFTGSHATSYYQETVFGFAATPAFWFVLRNNKKLYYKLFKCAALRLVPPQP